MARLLARLAAPGWIILLSILSSNSYGECRGTPNDINVLQANGLIIETVADSSKGIKLVKTYLQTLDISEAQKKTWMEQARQFFTATKPGQVIASVSNNDKESLPIGFVSLKDNCIINKLHLPEYHNLDVWPMQMHEVCIPVNKDGRFSVTFESSMPLLFDIHYHLEDDTAVYLYKHSFIMQEQTAVIAPDNYLLCAAWHNSTSMAIRLRAFVQPFPALK